MHGTEEVRKVWVGGSVNFRILTLVQRTHALIIGNSQSNQEVHKETGDVRGDDSDFSPFIGKPQVEGEM